MFWVSWYLKQGTLADCAIASAVRALAYRSRKSPETKLQGCLKAESGIALEVPLLIIRGYIQVLFCIHISRIRLCCGLQIRFRIRQTSHMVGKIVNPEIVLSLCAMAPYRVGARVDCFQSTWVVSQGQKLVHPGFPDASSHN